MAHKHVANKLYLNIYIRTFDTPSSADVISGVPNTLCEYSNIFCIFKLRGKLCKYTYIYEINLIPVISLYSDILI